MNGRLLLLSLLAGLLAAFYFLGDGEESTAVEVRRATPTLEPGQAQALDLSTLGAGNPLAALSLDDLEATRQRPLFSASRRPPPPPPEPEPAPVVEMAPAPPPAPSEPPAPPPQTGRFSLSGIVQSEGGALILLRDLTTGETLRLRDGEEIDGWRVEATGNRGVLLTKQGVEDRLQLFASEEENAQ